MSGVIAARSALSKYYKSGEIDVVKGGLFEVTHGLGVMPKAINLFVVCISADQGYSVGDVVTVDRGDFADADQPYSWGVTFKADTQKISGCFGAGSLGVVFMVNGHSSNGDRRGLEVTKWRLIVEVFA